jgi:uncharacterized protein (DUF736 family)
MIIGRFEKHDDSTFTGLIETLGIQLNPVRLVALEKGADYAVCGPDDGELGAAFHRSGEWGAYLSVRLDCPTLPAPISATMKLTPSEDGCYFLRWTRRSENGRGERERSNNPPDRAE